MDVTILRDVSSLLLDQVVDTLTRQKVPVDLVNSFRSESLGCLSSIFSPSLSKETKTEFFHRLQDSPSRLEAELTRRTSFSEEKMDHLFSLLEIFVGAISSIYSMFIYGDT